jgi:hypothetical integral membrane protein (TIGR02206 family)
MAPRFVPFGPAHLAALGLSVAGGIALVRLVRRGPETLAWAVRVSLAGLIGLLAGSEILRGLATGELTIGEVLPFHLCDMAMLLAIYALLTRDRRVAELVWFWAGSGTLLAMITPDVYLGFPSWQFVLFFGLHGLVVAAALVLVFGLSLRPRPGGPGRAFVLTSAYAAVVGIVNAAFGTNYMYLCRKPPNPTLLDAFGPWPVYLAAAALVALAAFALLGLPFRRERA